MKSVSATSREANLLEKTDSHRILRKKKKDGGSQPEEQEKTVPEV